MSNKTKRKTKPRSTTKLKPVIRDVAQEHPKVLRSTEVPNSTDFSSPWPGTGMPPVCAERGEEKRDKTDETYTEMRSPEEIGRASDELAKKVWYYRKLVMLQKIEKGEEEMPPSDIADRMFAEMTRVEEQYGEHN